VRRKELRFNCNFTSKTLVVRMYGFDIIPARSHHQRPWWMFSSRRFFSARSKVYTPFAGIGDGSFHLVGRLGGMVGRGADVSSLYDLRYHFLVVAWRKLFPITILDWVAQVGLRHSSEVHILLISRKGIPLADGTLVSRFSFGFELKYFLCGRLSFRYQLVLIRVAVLGFKHHARMRRGRFWVC
jgi:hypothetical protein